MSYGKFFSSCFTGSMAGSGTDVFAVWAYVIANAIDGQVELNPLILSAILGTSADKVEAAIEKLTSPDPKSRNKKHEGRRLIKEGEYAYHVVSHALYRAMRNEDERREYNRIKKRESRERSVSMTNFDMSAMSAQAEAETEAETKEKNSSYHKDSRTALHFLNEASGKSFREVHGNLSVISARLSESGVDLAGVKKMVERQCSMWKGTDMGEYLRPDTLFRPSKFESYYASRNDPLPTAGPKSPVAGAQKPISSVFNLKTVIEAKEAQAKALKDAYCVEGPLTNDWSSKAKWAEFAALRQEIKALRAQLADLL